MARLAIKRTINCDMHENESYPAYYSRLDNLLGELQSKVTQEQIDRGDVEGVVLQFPFADGYAYYLVTKATPLTVEHLPIGDAWEVNPALIRGLRKQDVLDQAQRMLDLRTMFANKK